ncbi:Integrase catalytic core protein [Phytophthora cinnamomi]|uniref:Integrase catalytic core protein n=1 Tax=Phytophthora cinnamomi TaxID=4785 RepID=UPI00355940D8|nr:Integrase catalytic core protein [Phytophthora cinnamomi]
MPTLQYVMERMLETFKTTFDFLVFFEKRFDCRIHVLRTDSGGEYQNVDLFCKKTGVARQRSEANNQASNERASAKLCLGDENGDNVDESTSEGEDVAEGADGEGIGAASSRKKRKKRAKKSWQRERPVTRSVTQHTADNADESAQQEETPADVVNSVVEAALNIFARLCVAGTANNG